MEASEKRLRSSSEFDFVICHQETRRYIFVVFLFHFESQISEILLLLTGPCLWGQGVLDLDLHKIVEAAHEVVVNRERLGHFSFGNNFQVLFRRK